jgi:capreomycidine synthase
MKLPPAALEIWMRDRFHSATVDIGSSGVAPLGFAELRRMTGITVDELDAILLTDSTSFGGPAVRDALRSHLGIDERHELMVTHGSSEALFLAMTALVDSSDEVVVEAPGYHAIADVATGLGATVRRWRLRPEDGFRPDLDELRRLVTDRTKVIGVAFPNNPTGVSLTPAELDELLDIAARHGAHVLWDGAFGRMPLTEAPLPDPLGAYDRVVVTGTLSKAYGLPGLRVGWCIADRSLLQATLALRDRTTLHLSPVIEHLTARMAPHLDAVAAAAMHRARRNLEVLAAWSHDHADEIDWLAPAGGVSCFPRLRGGRDVDALCRWLSDVRKVLVVPGSCFGCPEHLRIGFGGSTNSLLDGMNYLHDALDRGMW